MLSRLSSYTGRRECPARTIMSSTSSIGSSTLTARMPMRGTMTSWTRLSPSSMTPWIISFSSSSMPPCSDPVSTSSFSSSVER